jgi:hypothetical protein
VILSCYAILNWHKQEEEGANGAAAATTMGIAQQAETAD